MEKAIGIVTYTKDNFAMVKIDRKGMCGDNCATCKSICSLHDTVVRAVNTKNAKAGQKVSVEISTEKGFLAMIIAYGIPLLYSLIITVLMALFLPEKVGASVLLAGVVLWFLALWFLEKKGLFIRSFKTEITEILDV